MKKILIVYMLALCGIAYTQTTNNDCINGISTNPVSSTNPQATSSYLQAPELKNTFFDWHARQGTNGLAPWVSTNMIYDPNNAFGGPNYYISPFDPNGTPYATGYFPTSYDKADFHPEDGWELLYMNMGHNPDGSATINKISSTPYVILYNKFRSIVRVFGKTGDINYITNPIKSVQIKFNFAKPPTDQTTHDGVSGLFSGQNNYITALDKKTEVYQVVSLVNHPNTVNQWFHADFHVNYDPCQCYFRSELQLSFKFISSQSISLVGRSVSMDLPIGGSGNVDYGKNFLTNIYTDGDDETGPGAAAVAGSVIYKSMDAMLDDYIAKMTELEAYNNNSSIKRAKVIFEVYKSVKNTAITSLSGTIAGKVMKYAPEIIKNVRTLTGDTTIDIKKSDVENLVKTALGLGGKSLDALVSSQLGITDPPPTPTMPYATFTEMSIAGNIKTTSKVVLPNLMVPGTYNYNTVNSGAYSTTEFVNVLRYPIYNEALGTFAMLETPKLKSFENKFVERTYSSTYESYFGSDQFSDACNINVYYTSIANFRKNLKFDPVPKFYFNPNVNINWSKSNIKFQVIVEAPPVSTNALINFEFKNLHRDPFSKNVNTFSSHILSINCLQDLSMELKSNNQFSNEFVHYIGGCTNGQASATYNDPAHQINVDNTDFTTNFDAAQDAYQTYTYIFNNSKIYLKLIVDAEYNSLDHNGNPNKNTMIQTYLITPEAAANDFSGSIPFDITDVQETETVNTDNHIVSKTYNPLSMLSVVGNMTSADGFNHNYFAGETVAIQGEGSVIASNTSDFNLEINQIFTCPSNYSPLSSSEVNAFCHSVNYQANKLNNPSAFRNNNSVTNNSRIANTNTIDLIASVNEESKLMLFSKNENDEYKNFVLIDMQGHVLVSEKYLPKEINMINYAPGVYVIQYQTENGLVNKKIVKSN